ncbi:MAG: hypothetical protein BWY64_00791 [bacterium ADurb.Bin363]|nr:MAG: hypothetical protein BWY64_00791 [bacterium ADurb.Bin363]
MAVLSVFQINSFKQEELWREIIREIKKDLNAKNTVKLLKYMIFSVKRNIFQIKEGELMKEIKELSEYNESINKLFDDDFLGKILRNKDDESMNKLFDDEFLGQILRKKGKEYLTNFLFNLINQDEEVKTRIYGIFEITRIF